MEGIALNCQTESRSSLHAVIGAAAEGAFHVRHITTTEDDRWSVSVSLSPFYCSSADSDQFCKD